jgi:hypothetical protein
MKKYLFIPYFVLSLFLIASCSKNAEELETDSDSDNSSDSVSINESAQDYVWDSSEVAYITLNETSITTNSSGVTIEGTKATITTAGTYSISGSLTDGQIIVDTEDETIVRLIFNGITVTCSNSAPVFIKKAEKALIVLADNTTSTLTDGSSYSFASADEDEPAAAIYSKANLAFYGNGLLSIDANYNDAIASKDGLIVRSGTFNITSVDDGIRGKDYLLIYDGNFTINAGGDGLKSDNEDSKSVGFITIKAGNFNITSTGDAIQAQTDVEITDGEFTLTCAGGSSKTLTDALASAKGVKAQDTVKINNGTFSINTADDAVHSNSVVVINGGEFLLSTADDGIHAETSLTVNNGTITISKAYEGLEAKTITINDGNVSVTASNDCLNASAGTVTGGSESNDGSYLYINGGTVTASVSNGDGLDSNGSIAISGGAVVVQGPPSQPELGMDYNGTCNISGGVVLVAGPNSDRMIQAESTSSTQYGIKATCSSSTLSASTLFHIQDASGNDIVTFKPVRATYYIVFSAPSLVSGTKYYIYTGGTVSGGTNINGLYTGATYDGGTLKTSSGFTLSSKVTSVSF